jgi:ribosome-binding protein aMBF1 (putative translation factor)
MANKLIEDGWRPGSLAEELEVGTKTIAAWHRGQSVPTIEQLEHMREIVRPDETRSAPHSIGPSLDAPAPRTMLR